MQRLIVLLSVLLLLAPGAVLAQEAGAETVADVWYWGIDAEHATLVAYNLNGIINSLDVALDPLDPQVTILRVDSDSAFALVDHAGQLIVYEVTSDSARRVAAFGQ